MKSCPAVCHCYYIAIKPDQGQKLLLLSHIKIAINSLIWTSIFRYGMGSLICGEIIRLFILALFVIPSLSRFCTDN